MKALPCDITDRLHRRLADLYGDDKADRLLDRVGILAIRYGFPDRYRRPGEQASSTWSQKDRVLITYGDMVQTDGEAPLQTLGRFLSRYLGDSISCVHILPFFPSSSDEGFSVIDYRQVDPALGTWADVEMIAHGFELMFDLVLNHCSRKSSWIRDFENNIAPGRDFFIALPEDTDVGMVVRPRTSPLLSPARTSCGDRWLWTTFSADQVDLNFANQDVLFAFLDILVGYVRKGARIIRLDAIAYLWKELGTPCINLPQTHEVVKLMRDVLDMLAPNTLLLTETNLPHDQNISYFGNSDEARIVYQFSLPPLLLHALLTGSTRYLVSWARGLQPPPRGCTFLNFTASHDGIGVRPLEGLVPPHEIQKLADAVLHRGGHVSSRAGPDGEASPYELNITYFDALADPEQGDSERQIARFLCSQTIMLALQGIPAVYFHSLTATGNDHGGVAASGQPRSINRRRWNEHELEVLLSEPASVTSRVFREYNRLLAIRAGHAAFHPDGEQRILELQDGCLGIERTAPDGSEMVVSLSNLTSEKKTLRSDALDPGGHPTGQWEWEELSRGGRVEITEARPLTLEPYESLWLRVF